MSDSTRHPVRRIARFILRLVAVLLAVVVLAAASLLLRPVRDRVLALALEQARDALPGSLLVGDARWSAPGRIELTGVSWMDEADTLVLADHVAVTIALGPLVEKRLVVRDLSARELRADVPAVLERFPAATSAETEPTARTGGFLRAGSLPGVPAVAVDRFEVTAPRLRLPGDVGIDSLDVLGTVDLLDGRAPSIAIRRLRARDSAGRFRVDETRLDVDLDDGTLTGEGAGRARNGLGVVFTVTSTDPGRVNVDVTLADPADPSARDVRLALNADVEAALREDRALAFRTTLHVPARDSLPVGLRALAERAPAFTRFRVDAGGRYERGAVTVDTLTARFDSLVVGARGTREATGAVTANVTARGSARGVELAVSLRATADRPDDWHVYVDPILVTAPGVSKEAKGHAGDLRVDGAGNVTAERITVVGDAGRYTLDGTWSAAKRGTFRLDADLGRAPPLLVDRLARTPDERREVTAAWPDTLRGLIRGTADLSGEVRHARGTIRVTSPRWVDSTLVVVSVTGEDVAIDSATVALPGVDMHARGGLRNGEWDAFVHAAWDSAGVVPRLLPAATGLTGSADVTIGGARSRPRVDVSLAAAYASGGTRVPAVRATGSWTEERLGLRVRCPSGVTAGAVVLDSLTAAFESAGREPFPATVSLAARGRDLALVQRLDVNREGTAWRIASDSLWVDMRGQRLRAPQSFRITAVPERKRLVLEDILLSGSLGTLRASGVAQPDSSDLDIQVDVTLPPKPASLVLSEAAWPDHVALSLSARDAHDLTASLVVSGFDVGAHAGLVARLNAVASEDSLRADVTVSGDTGDVLTGTARVPGRVDVFPPRGALGRGRLDARIALSGFPVPDRRSPAGSGGADMARVDGDVWLGGTSAEPEAGADVTVRFPEGSPLSTYVADVDLYASSWTRPDSVPARARADGLVRLLSSLDPDEPVGIVAAARVTARGVRVADASVRIPVEGSFEPPVFAFHEDRSLTARASSDTLSLRELAPLLPADIGLGGTIQFDVGAEGPASNAALSGTVTGRALRFTHANGTRIAANGALRLSGTTAAPSIAGTVQIENGVITIPDPPKDLHPTEGEAILWRTMEAERRDSTDASASAAADTTSGDTAVPDMELDVTLDIPSGLWIRGQGLDVELAGNLTLTQRGASPVITGTLNAVRGQFLFMGRTFEVRQGRAVFYGDDHVSPTLDLELTTNVEGTVITVRMQGTAEDPEVTLTSEPSMPEGDIMSFLVFGKRLDELNSDQVGLVQQRAAETAATFGTQLASRLSRQMGVDLLTLSRGRDGQSTLTIGKYVTRRALLKYEQSLEESATFLIDLEYFLTQTLRLETFLGQQQQSGLEFNWTRDY